MKLPSWPFVLLGGAGIGIVVARSFAAPPPPAAQPKPTPSIERHDISVPPLVINAAMGEFDQSAIRDAVREELKSVHAAAPSGPSDPAVPTPENDDAHERSEELLQAGQAARHWTAENVASMRQMTDDQRQAIIKDLFKAINAGEIRVDVVGPPF